jgi:hypothetical protein
MRSVHVQVQRTVVGWKKSKTGSAKHRMMKEYKASQAAWPCLALYRVSLHFPNQLKLTITEIATE